MGTVTVNKVYRGRIERKILENARKACMRVLRGEGCGKREEAAITFVDDEHIRQLNKKHRKLDRATDVLSFATGEEGLLGDVVISIDTAKRNAKRFGSELNEEIERLVVHGTLHLLGYDHVSAKKRMAMREKEGYYI